MSATRLATATRRLPGLRFEAQSPPLADSMPRMDVAIFAGFASSGPINQPVVIEDSAQFAAIFGEDAPLAWNSERGLPTRSYLGPTVRDFFRQGGRRCWIIRLARDAIYNYFPIPALLEQRPNGDLFPAFARARSEGSWSDGLLVGASLQVHSIKVTRAFFFEQQFELSPNSPSDVQPGDLLRFNLRDEGCGLFAVVESVQAVDAEAESPPSAVTSATPGPAAHRHTARVQCAKPLWFKSRWLEDSVNGPVDVVSPKPLWFTTPLFGHLSLPRVSPVVTVNDDGSSGPPLDVLLWSLSDDGQNIALRFLSPGPVFEAGAKLLIEYFHLQLLVTVHEVADGEPFGASPPRETVQMFGSVDRWLPRPMKASIFDHKGAGSLIQVTEGPFVNREKITLNCAIALADAPAPGTLMRVDFSSGELWLTVAEVSSIDDASGSSPTGWVRIEGGGFWRFDGPPDLSPATPVEAERLTFDLLVREFGDKAARLRDLGFDERHSRYWGAWPTDEQRYQVMRTTAFIAGARANPVGAREFFPLAKSDARTFTNLNDRGRGPQPSSALYLPVAMPFMAEALLGAIDQSKSALERDGLAVLDADLFLDEQIIETDVEDLMAQADYLRYQSPTPRNLRGIHAALDIEEASIIAVPDAVHRGWTYKPFARVPPQPSDRLTHPKWWRFMDCNPSPQQLPLADHPAWGNFLDCDLRVLDPPLLESEAEAPSGTIVLVWSSVRDTSRYVVEESRSPAWASTEVIYSGSMTRLVIYGRSAGDYYYRVRAETASASSDWSSEISVRKGSTNQWQVTKREEYQPSLLLDVHRALLQLCAARADLFAVLALPEHYREDDAISHAEILRPLAGSRATSYGAVYHPWLVTRRDDFLEPWELVPPDGAASGVMAQHAITRGAWSAPANELLRGVVALAPPLAAGRRGDLQDAQVNILRHEPRGFLCLSADTLSRDVDLRPINVRRLLILLRRLALRLGETYLFEPNDDSFRRLVQRGFEAALDRMFARGAFAGSTAATSYQVVTDDSINTPASVDQGRFIVELKVAPSLPLTFITVRLVQTNDRSLVTEVR
jgi:hypothetical protein